MLSEFVIAYKHMVVNTFSVYSYTEAVLVFALSSFFKPKVYNALFKLLVCCKTLKQYSGVVCFRGIVCGLKKWNALNFSEHELLPDMFFTLFYIKTERLWLSMETRCAFYALRLTLAVSALFTHTGYLTPCSRHDVKRQKPNIFYRKEEKETECHSCRAFGGASTKTND